MLPSKIKPHIPTTSTMFDFLWNVNCIIEITIASNVPAVNSWRRSDADDNQDPTTTKNRPIRWRVCEDVKDEGAFNK